MNWILFTVIYCKTVQFATINQIQFATVNLNYSNSYCKNTLKCLTGQMNDS